MVRPQRPDHERGYEDRNGLDYSSYKRQAKNAAHDLSENLRDTAEQASEQVRRMGPDYQGYALILAGALLFLFSLGFFPILKWVMAGVAVILALWGAAKADLFRSLTNYAQRMSNKNKRNR